MTIAALTLTLAAAIAAQADTVVKVEPDSRLWIRNLPGHVWVETWGKNAVRLRSTGASGERARIARHGPALTIELKRAPRTAQPAHYVVTVPTWMAVALVSPDATARVRGLKGDLLIRTVNGGVDVEDNDGSVSVSSVQGPVRVSRARGRLEVNTVNGPIALDEVTGQVYAETVNGGIELARMLADSIDASTVNGAVSFDGNMVDGGWYRFATHRGDIDVGLPDRPDARVSVATYAGEFESDVPVHAPHAHERQHLQFTLGDGRAWLQLESFLGRIRLVRAPAGARRAPPPVFEWPDRVSPPDEDEEDKE